MALGGGWGLVILAPPGTTTAVPVPVLAPAVPGGLPNGIFVPMFFAQLVTCAPNQLPAQSRPERQEDGASHFCHAELSGRGGEDLPRWGQQATGCGPALHDGRADQAGMYPGVSQNGIAMAASEQTWMSEGDTPAAGKRMFTSESDIATTGAYTSTASTVTRSVYASTASEGSWTSESGLQLECVRGDSDAKQQQGERREEGTSGRAEAGPTTMMVRNLPSSFTKKELMAELETAGFGGQYDYVYVPRDLATGDNNGFGFINFTMAAAAARFVSEWVPTIADRDNVNVAPSAVQGFSENYKRWSMKKAVIRDSKFKPFFRQRS